MSCRRLQVLKSSLSRWYREGAGQDLLEYALISAFVAVVVLAGASRYGASVNDWFVAVSGVAGDADGAGNGRKSSCSGQGMVSSKGKCSGG